MKIFIGNISPRLSDEDIVALVSADGRGKAEVKRFKNNFGQVKAFVVVTVDVALGVLVNALDGQRLDHRTLSVKPATAPTHRRGSRGAYSAARASQRQVERLNDDDSKYQRMVSAVDEGKALVHTTSHFHDPRKRVAQKISEALDPTKAPKLLRHETFETPVPVRAGPGPETKTILERLEVVCARRRAFEEARDRARERAGREAPKRERASPARGVLTPLEEEGKPGKGQAETTERAVIFLRTWLGAGPQYARDVRLDAARDGITKAALTRARRLLAVRTTPEGLWTCEPKPQPSMPYRLLHYPSWWLDVYWAYFQRLRRGVRCDRARAERDCGPMPNGCVVRRCNFFGRGCYSTEDDPPFVWVRDPEDVLLLGLHVTRVGDRFGLAGIRASDKRALAEIDVKTWDREAHTWWTENEAQAQRALDHVIAVAKRPVSKTGGTVDG